MLQLAPQYLPTGAGASSAGAGSSSGVGSEQETARGSATVRLWERLLSQPALSAPISEYCKLGKVVMAIPIGSVANERRFSRMSIVKSKHRNRLEQKHLNTCLRIAGSNHTHTNFDYNRAFEIWWDNHGKQNRRGASMAPQQ